MNHPSPLDVALQQLRLPVFGQLYARLAQEANARPLSYEGFLLALAEQELAYRDRQRQQQYLKLPALSLGLWHNFGDTTPLDTQRAVHPQQVVHRLLGEILHRHDPARRQFIGQRPVHAVHRQQIDLSRRIRHHLSRRRLDARSRTGGSASSHRAAAMSPGAPGRPSPATCSVARPSAPRRARNRPRCGGGCFRLFVAVIFPAVRESKRRPAGQRNRDLRDGNPAPGLPVAGGSDHPLGRPSLTVTSRVSD